jgi:hypothetical protein
MEAVLIVAIIFGSIAAVIVTPFWLRTQERIRVQETLRAAIESGQAMPTEVMENAARTINLRPAPSPSRDLRTGIVWLGLAVGFAAMGMALSFEWPDAAIPIVSCAAFPAFIGLAFIVLSFVNRPKS